MKTAVSRIFFVFLICLITTTTNVAAFQKAQTGQSGEILHLIEKYKAPPYPKDGYITKETYDYRIGDKRTIPPTLTDTFIADIWQRITLDLKLKIEPENITEENVKDAIAIYLTKN